MKTKKDPKQDLSRNETGNSGLARLRQKNLLTAAAQIRHSTAHWTQHVTPGAIVDARLLA